MNTARLGYALALAGALGALYLSSRPVGPPKPPAGSELEAITQSAEYRAELDRLVKRLNYLSRDAATITAPDPNTILYVFHADWDRYAERDKIVVLRGASDSFIDIRQALGIRFNPVKRPENTPTILVRDKRGRLLARHRYQTTEFFDPDNPKAKPRKVTRKETSWEMMSRG